MRIPLKERNLPPYSTGEEIFNSISHGIGALLSVAGLVLMLVESVRFGDAWSVVSAAIYGSTLIILYTMSCLYHGLTHFMAKRVFQVIDHCSIFLLIAGSYTPLTLALLRRERPGLAWTIFGVVWASAVLGIVLNSIDLKRFSTFSMVCYIAMGWCIIVAIRPLKQMLPAAALRLLVWGGVAYTVGAVLYGVGKRKFTWMHGVFHVFVLLGSILHFWCIYRYVLPL